MVDEVKETQFQSTLSVRRATAHLRRIHGEMAISIHALREESDQRFHARYRYDFDFNPRSP